MLRSRPGPVLHVGLRGSAGVPHGEVVIKGGPEVPLDDTRYPESPPPAAVGFPQVPRQWMIEQ
jgi:hypothetical protein